jgi:DNA polymerase elongation subunit (family B)
MAESITSSGQFSIKWIANRINKYLNSALKTNNTDYIIASDTDSVYVSLETLVETTQGEKSTEDKIKFMDSFCGKVLTPLIEKSYIELAEYMNAYEQKMQMKREVLADKGLWTAKKRYALRVHNSEGVQYDKPKMKIMGIEIVKSSTPTAIREKLKSTIDIIFNDTNLDLIRFIEDTRQEFKTLAVEDIAIPSTVNGMIKFSNDKTIYSKGCPIYVRGGLLYNKVVKDMKLDQKYPLIGAGDKLKYVYLKLPNTIKEDVIGFPTELPMEFGLHKYIDYNTQFEKVFLNPLEKIVDAIGWNLKEQSTLDAFF